METETKPEIILYDLACAKDVCFSPVVWRIRLMLNFKRIPYKTIFLEFPDIESTLKPLGMVPVKPDGKFTVPAIHHVPTDTYMMDSVPISQFLEATYPDPPVPLDTERGREIETKARTLLGPVLKTSILPREILILSPRAQQYFRRTREAWLGHPLEDLLDAEKEEKAWAAVDGDLHAVGQLIREKSSDGPFVLGAKPSYSDFFIAGALQSNRVVDEGVFERIMKYPGFNDVYTACLPWMEKKD
ncbi:hypothetical protein DM02DRAFT_618469 [Periconia macrospinosa]|uniref:Uncharacterized protein n=1 Tax=Periconia macrospinosa TaxID=97972 RepID=A0A2V1DAV7_9PLEO|nr:hypothetical protein DM02DRAFT_618469 [Periconia macrospinosa]